MWYTCSIHIDLKWFFHFIQYLWNELCVLRHKEFQKYRMKWKLISDSFYHMLNSQKREKNEVFLPILQRNTRQLLDVIYKSWKNTSDQVWVPSVCVNVWKIELCPFWNLEYWKYTVFRIFSYMLWHIELKFCIWLYYTVLQIKFECRQFVSMFVGVAPLLELIIL